MDIHQMRKPVRAALSILQQFVTVLGGGLLDSSARVRYTQLY